MRCELKSLIYSGSGRRHSKVLSQRRPYFLHLEMRMKGNPSITEYLLSFNITEFRSIISVNRNFVVLACCGSPLFQVKKMEMMMTFDNQCFVLNLNSLYAP